LDVSPPNLKSLLIEGELAFDLNQDLNLTADWIIVSGSRAKFNVGSETQPYTRRATITLTGTNTAENIMGMGTKVLGVMGGELKIRGEDRLSWTQLGADATVGATSIQTVASPSTWRTGDRIVITAGGFDPRESEVVTVTGVTGNTVRFTPALAFARFARVQTYDGKTLDQRPHVGLLSRNILIQGAADSDADAFGGHTMVMAGSRAQIEGVEFFKMGQRGRFGRYPMHWHLAADRAGDYLKNSAIHNSFHRAAVIHSTNNVLLEGNVAYNIPSHAFVWAEDGDERGNQLIRNLGILIRNPAPEHFAFPINNALHGNSSQSEQRVGVFWGRSYGGLVFRDNVSAGALDGFGLFFDLFTPAPKALANEGSGLIFDNNIAYATYKTLSTGNQINYPEATTGHGLMVSTGTSGQITHVFNGYTGYHNVSGAWFEDRATQLKNSILADNGIGAMVLRALVDGVTVVGQSAHPVVVPNMPASVNFNFRAGIQVAGSNHGGKRAPRILNTKIINQAGAGIIWDLDNISPASEVRNIQYINTARPSIVVNPFRFEFFPDSPNFGLADPTGALTGTGQPSRVFMRDAMLADANCTAMLDAQIYSCPLADSLLLKSFDDITLTESNGLATVLRGFDYYDAGMPEDGIAVGYMRNGGRYTVRTTARTRYDFVIDEAAGKSLELAFFVSGAPLNISLANGALQNAGSLAAMRGASTSGFFHDNSAGMLYVRVVVGANASAAQSLVVQAPFVANYIARAAVDLPAGATNGLKFVRNAGAATYAYKYAVPAATPTSFGNLNDAIVNPTTVSPALSAASAGVTTSLQGFVFAPTDGFYRISLMGSGGGTSLYVGNDFLMGEPWAFINSNWIRNGQLTSDFGVFQPNGLIALKAGWHPITIVHAKLPNNNDGNSLYLRWIPPSGNDTWVYPEVRRAP
jgi:hypothetical protein